jgi:protein-S-isoprenylcysteine O-methyltransferase Ste14
MTALFWSRHPILFCLLLWTSAGVLCVGAAVALAELESNADPALTLEAR